VTVDGHGGTRGPGIGAVAFVPVAATVAVTIGLLWATGNVSALLAHGRRPRAKLEDVGAVAVRLVRHPGDPAGAWPAGDRELIPGPTGFYGTLLVLLALAVALVGLSWRIYQRLRNRLSATGE
jgi:type IV secretion system protein VirD4